MSYIIHSEFEYNFVYHAAKHDNSNIKCDSRSHALSKGRYLFREFKGFRLCFKVKTLI